MATVVLADDRRGVEIRARAGETAVVDAVRAMDLPARPRRTRAGLHVRFDAAHVLLERGPTTLRWESEARRAVENRVAIRTTAPRVLPEVRRLLAAPLEEIRESIRDCQFIDALDDHQARNVAIMTLADGWGACVFDEQGTGKTITTIAAFDLLVERRAIDLMIVVAPKSMIAEWATELDRFTKKLYGVAIADGTRRDRARAIESGADVVVINYETAITLAENLRLLARRCRVMLVVDESFAVKNPGAQRTHALMDLREWCARAYVLCGTPAPNAARDVVSQFDLVDLGYTFSNVRLDPEPAVQARQIRDAMDARGVFTRSLKRLVLPHLPGRVFTQVPVVMAPQQRRAYQAALDGLIGDIRGITDAQFRRRLATYLQRRAALLRICSNPSPLVPGYSETPAKLEALDGLLQELIGERGEKVVLWSFYRASLDVIARRYARYGIARIEGDVPVTDRHDAVRRFQDDDRTMLFVGNPAAGGAGITLHRARVAVYESLSNQAAHYLQSLDRIHRRGQERDVEYLTLICSGTLEEREYGRLLNKADAQADLLGDPPSDAPTRELMLADLLDTKRLLDGAED